jgi:saccharopine dehydrogenase (NAD+, L-lysine-forming)
MTMDIAIIGSGAVASVMSRLLSDEKGIRSLTFGARDMLEAGRNIRKHDKISVRRLDASDPDALRRLAKECDLVVNASLPRFNIPIMKACLDSGSCYQDLCSELEDLRNPEQLALHKRFSKESLLGLINTGVAPGITNLLCRECADSLDSVRDIRVRLLEHQASQKVVFSWSPETTLDMLRSKPLIYRKGRYALCEPFGEVEEFGFPKPFGRRSVAAIYGDEVATVPRYLKLRNMDVKASGADIDFSMMIQRLGLLNRESVMIEGKRMKPLDLLAAMCPKVPGPREMAQLIRKGIIKNGTFISCVEAYGKKDGLRARIRMCAVYPGIRQILRDFGGATYVSYPSGLAASIFAKRFSDFPQRGVIPPEALGFEGRRLVLEDLVRSGVRLSRMLKES